MIKKVVCSLAFVLLCSFLQTLTIAATGDLLQTFNEPGMKEESAFGMSITSDGNNVFAGACRVNAGTTANAGVVYMFNGSTGKLLRTFQKPTPAVGDQFGRCIALMGKNILIGAHTDDTGAQNTGAVYLFDSSTGKLLRSFLNPTPVKNDEFGNSIAVVGNNILVGAFRANDAGIGASGAAYLFDGSTGKLLHTFLKPAAAPADHFGVCVAARGKDVLISAKGDGTSPKLAGAAYLFDGSTGKLLHKFLDPNPAIKGHFGSKLAAIGNNVLISAPKSNTGAVYLFDGSTGELLRTFHSPTSVKRDYFGCNIASEENNVLIQAMHTPTGPRNAGVVYVFSSSTGKLVRTFQNPSPDENDVFGSCITTAGNNILIGAVGDDTGSTNSGIVYLFKGI